MMNKTSTRQLYRWIIEHADQLPCTVKCYSKHDGQGMVSHLIVMRPNGDEVAIMRSMWDSEEFAVYAAYPDDPQTIWAELRNNLVTYEQQCNTSPVKLVQDTQLLLSLSPVHIDQLIWRRRCLLFLQENVSDSNFSIRISELIHKITECLAIATQEPDLIQIKNPKPVEAA